MSVTTFNLPRQHARAARMAYSCETLPTKANDNHGFELPRDDYDPILRMAGGVVSLVLSLCVGAGIAGGWAVAAALVQGGWL